MPGVLSSLLSQFRERYPQGSVTSELLTTHDGLYVVRVCVSVDGVTLASSLGANSAIEAAEDTATSRALERLSFPAAASASVADSGDLQPATNPAVAPPLVLFDPDNGALPPAEESVTIATRAEPIALPVLAQSAAPETSTAASSATLTTLPLPPVDAVDEGASSGISMNTPVNSLAVAAPNEPASEFIDLGTGSTGSIDLSDIIAQTDVELQRLGWDVNKGREFLEKTYGKRSRHDLTDDELLEFLLYLETQSAPD
ncbi:MAG: hypothetical protein WBG38_12830 [Nodosilinea sp.]